jgi:hypothetical protein
MMVAWRPGSRATMDLMADACVRRTRAQGDVQAWRWDVNRGTPASLRPGRTPGAGAGSNPLDSLRRTSAHARGPERRPARTTAAARGRAHARVLGSACCHPGGEGVGRACAAPSCLAATAAMSPTGPSPSTATAAPPGAAACSAMRPRSAQNQPVASTSPHSTACAPRAL